MKKRKCQNVLFLLSPLMISRLNTMHGICVGLPITSINRRRTDTERGLNLVVVYSRTCKSCHLMYKIEFSANVLCTSVHYRKDYD